jgi:uncharacterized membrane protein
LNQAVNLTAAGALSGGFWGSLIGLIFLCPMLGFAIGAATGAASGALTECGKSVKSSLCQTKQPTEKQRSVEDSSGPFGWVAGETG